jgi:hypothetical protein
VTSSAPLVPRPAPAARLMQVRAGVQGESACKPASVPRGVPGVAAIHLGPALPPASCGPPGDSAGPASGPRCRGRMSPIRPCSGWGLPSRPVTRPLVRSYRTVSPLPPCSRRVAVCSLWHCPAGRPDWRLASTLPCGGRTFLDPGEPGPRPPSRLPLHHQVCHPIAARRGTTDLLQRKNESIRDRTYVRVSWHEARRVGSR